MARRMLNARKAAFLMGSLSVFIAITPLSAQSGVKGWTGPKPAKPPCECRYKGGKATLGETICRSIGGKMMTLRCDLVLNNTNWTAIEEGCATANMSVPAGDIKRL